MSRPLSISFKSILLAILVLLFFNVRSGADVPIIWFCLAIVYVIILSSAVRPLRIVDSIPTYMKIDLLFGIFFYVVFIQPYQLAVLGLHDLRSSSFLDYTFASESNRAIVLATAGLVAFNLGFHILQFKPAQSQNKSSQTSPLYLGLDTFVPLALTACCLLYLGTGMRSSGEGRYTGTGSGGSAADGIALLITMFSIIAIALICARRLQNLRIHPLLWWALVVGVAWAARTLIAGDRNTFLLYAVALIGGALTYFIRAGRITLVALMLAALILYNVIEFARMASNPTTEQLIASLFNAKAAEGATDNSFNITTTSVRAGLDAVPGVFDFGYGYYKLLGFVGVIPFVRGWFFDPTTNFATTTDVLTHVMIGPNRGWSVGTNVITDSYIDFGVAGVIIILMLVGLASGVAQHAALRNPSSTKATVFYLLSMAMFAELPRYAVDFPVRVLVWTALLFWVAHLLTPNAKVSKHLDGRNHYSTYPF